jgi:hypothetical protein
VKLRGVTFILEDTCMPVTTSPIVPTRAHLDALFDELDPPKARVIFAVDATASRQPTWDMASKLTAEMFRAATAGGGLELQLVYFRGERECTASRWLSDARALARARSSVMCCSGMTQIGRVLEHARREDSRNRLAAVILVSDACEEIPETLYCGARRLGVPVFLFQEGTDEAVAAIYRTIATVTGGASCRFDAGAAAELANLLRAVVAFATGGRKALANQNTAAARLLLTQIRE